MVVEDKDAQEFVHSPQRVCSFETGYKNTQINGEYKEYMMSATYFLLMVISRRTSWKSLLLDFS